MDIDTLGSAVRSNNLEMAHQILDKKPELINLTPWNTDRNLLHYAAIYGLANMIDLLMIFQADVNAIDADNQMPIQLAVLHHRVDCVEALLEHQEADEKLVEFARAASEVSASQAIESDKALAKACLALLEQSASCAA